MASCLHVVTLLYFAVLFAASTGSRAEVEVDRPSTGFRPDVDYSSTVAASTGFRADRPYVVAASTARFGSEVQQPDAGFHTEFERDIELDSTDAVGFRADLKHPYAGTSVAVHDMWRLAARASKARVARLQARLTGNLSVPVAHISDEGYTVTVGIGTPPQPHTVIIDTGSDLTWTQCNIFNDTRRQQEPLFDPTKSSSFTYVPCNSSLCTDDNPGGKTCSNMTCRYDYLYGSVEAIGVLAYETFSFGDKDPVSLRFGFGCGALTDGSLLGASGIMGLAPPVLSMVSQLKIAKFSYCLTPYADRNTSSLFFGQLADLRRYKRTGKIQSVPLLRNTVSWTFFYYVPLVGLSLGTRRLDVPATTFELRDGGRGTVVDSGSTLAYLVEPAFTALKEAVLQTLDLPLTNRTVEDYKVCFALPSGVAMSSVQTPPLVLHFDGGADMVLPRDNYFQEPRVGLMCLAVAATSGFSIIGNVQQQNFHVLFDVHDSKFLFAPTNCDDI